MNWTQDQVDALKHDRAPVKLADESKRVFPALRAKGRVKPPKGMNKTESLYDAHLAMRKRLGEVLWYKFEGVTLKLADDTRLTPDFAVMLADGSIELHDTKVIRRGESRPHIEDDARAKMPIAAESFPFRIKAVWPLPSGEWGEREF